MRLLTLKLYRAFPELDRFSDEQCVRFIKATGRGWRRWLHVSVVGLVGLLGVVGAILLIGYLTKDAFKGREVTEFAVLSAAIAVGPLLAVIARDLLLRLRVRRVLRNRSGCTGCGYNLLGLAVGEGNTVRCPECGTVTEVDSSLGELSLDDEGRARFQPATDMVRAPRVFTPRRVKLLKRTLKMVAIAIVVGVPLMWGGYELWLQRQTEQARADRVPVQKIVEMVEAVQPAPIGSADDAWELFVGVQRAIETADARVDAGSPNAQGPGNNRIYADFTHIYYPPREDRQPTATTPEQRELWRKEEALAREHLLAYRADGVLEKLKALAAAPNAIAPINANPSMPLILSVQHELGRIRFLARMNAARMKMASDSGDMDEAVQAYEELLAFSRMCRTQPFLIDELVGIAIEAVASARLRPILAKHPSEQVLDKIEAAMKRQFTTLPRARAFELEKLMELDLIAYSFGDKRFTRFGRFSKDALSPWAGGWSGGGEAELPLGTYAQNREAMENHCTAFEKLAAMERWQRPAPYPKPPTHLRVLAQNSPAFERALMQMDYNEMDRRGLRAMIALERYFAKHREYPLSLAALVPDVLADVPIDPWSGKALCYIKIDAAKDPQGRGYLLYSTGGDGVDDGGKPAAKGFEPQSLDPGSSGTDYILNNLDR